MLGSGILSYPGNCPGAQNPRISGFEDNCRPMLLLQLWPRPSTKNTIFKFMHLFQRHVASYQILNLLGSNESHNLSYDLQICAKNAQNPKTEKFHWIPNTICADLMFVTYLDIVITNVCILWRNLSVLAVNLWKLSTLFLYFLVSLA